MDVETYDEKISTFRYPILFLLISFEDSILEIFGVLIIHSLSLGYWKEVY